MLLVLLDGTVRATVSAAEMDLTQLPPAATRTVVEICLEVANG